MQNRSSLRSRTKIPNACQRCRRKKIKCSGAVPCQGCTEHSAPCVFEKVEKKITIPETYFQHLISIAAQREQEETTVRDGSSPPAGAPRSFDTVEQRAVEDEEPAPQHIPMLETAAPPIEEVVPSIQNPLTSSESFFLRDSSGRQRYLGSSSSPDFSWQIRCFLKNIIGDDIPINLVPNSEEDTYTMASGSVRESLPLAADEMPSREYAKYLSETVLFHLGDIYHVFDKERFMEMLDAFYDRNQPLRNLSHVQLLLVIAFGKLFLRRGASSLGPPGAADFLRALRLQPDVLDLWDDPILRMEVLCLISLYLNTADMRPTAYTFIGQAVRIALSLGLNREPPPGQLSQREYQRRRRLWWTLYMIDKKLSTTIGAPLSIRDEDIDTSMPEEYDLGFSNTALKYHVKLARLEGEVVSGTITLYHYGFDWPLAAP
ncbi:hypothetical protein GQ53DRAFT_129539 [Thozetella sp. PMI_491]|nr:hypothetical protein GQ53DRAFT_129539 [Thozetella sp. PMI_491]